MPGEDLIRLLDDLRVSLDKSGIERTNGIRIGMGDNCEYYRKSLNIFLEKDYKKISSLIRKLNGLLPLSDQEITGKLV